MSSAFEGLPKTPNLKLNKPGYDNVADIEALNENADILDEEIQGIKNTFVKSVNGINAGDGGNVDLGIMPISEGGTGASTTENARKNLGIKDIATYDVLPISQGGTGATTPKQARENLGLGSMALEDNAIVNATISGKTITLTFADGTTKTLTTQDNGYHTGNATSIGGASATKPAVVVQSYNSGASWYRVWSDGWVEQGGRCKANTTITYSKAFANTDYIGFVISTNTSNYSYSFGINNRSTTSGKMAYHDNGYTGQVDWYVCGKGA